MLVSIAIITEMTETYTGKVEVLLIFILIVGT